jgi:hypothetical protein
VRLDYEKDGRPALYRVTTAGEDGEVLRRNGAPDVAREDMVRFAAMTPVIVTHRFFGRSIADLVMDIQRIKTALLRALLDNAYLANNPRTEIAESHATDTTLDDLLVSRPGGVVRTKMPGGLAVLRHPDIGGHVFPLLQYQDATREWRTGVSRQGQGLDADALRNQTATAANQLFGAAQARMKLIARIFAETGIRDLFSLLHATIRKHGQKPQTVRLRNQWVTVDPRGWSARNDMTIQVGLGSGGKSERLSQLMALIGLQKEALAGGLTQLVTPQNLYNSAKELVNLIDLKTVEPYFTDPRQAPPPAAAGTPDPAQAAVQAQLALQQAQTQAALAVQDRKIAGEIAVAERKAELERQRLVVEAELKAREQQRAALAAAFSTDCDADAAASTAAPASGSAIAAVVGELTAALRQLGTPKRIVRDAQGRVSHLEPMDQ